LAFGEYHILVRRYIGLCVVSFRANLLIPPLTLHHFGVELHQIVDSISYIAELS
jgi:hypothetical protein